MAKILNITRPVVAATTRISVLPGVTVRAPVPSFSGPGMSSHFAAPKTAQISVAKIAHATSSPPPPFDDEPENANTKPKRKKRQVDYAVSC